MSRDSQDSAPLVPTPVELEQRQAARYLRAWLRQIRGLLDAAGLQVIEANLDDVTEALRFLTDARSNVDSALQEVRNHLLASGDQEELREFERAKRFREESQVQDGAR